MPSAITVTNLSKDYLLYRHPKEALRIALGGPCKSYRALDDVTFEVGKGEVFGIIGANGAGKSTLLKVLAGVLTDFKGEVEIRGRTSAILEVSTSFASEMTGRENIYRHLLLQGHTKKEIAALEPGIIEYSELEDVIDQKLITYSSGMMAKLAFSVITAAISDVLLIDELLVVGDEHFQGKSFKRIKEICSSGRTVVIVSHNLSFVERLCTRAMWLDKGRMQRIGPAHEVCMAYLGKEAHEVSNSYPREYGYIDSITVECMGKALKIRTRIMRLKPTPDLHYQIAVHDNSTGVLSALMNTSWQELRLPAGVGPFDLTAEMPFLDGLCNGLVGTVLVRGSGSIPESVVEDSWGWESKRHVVFSRVKDGKTNAYVRVPMAWVRCS